MILRLSVLSLRIWFFILFDFGINIRSVNAPENAKAYDENWDQDNGGVPFLPDRIPWLNILPGLFLFRLFWGISWNDFAFTLILIIFNCLFLIFSIFSFIIFYRFFFVFSIFYFLFLNYDTLYIDNFKIKHAVYNIRCTPNRKINYVIFILLQNLVLNFDRFIDIWVLFHNFLLWLAILLNFLIFLILLFKYSSPIVILLSDLWILSSLSIWIVVFNFINVFILFWIGLLLLWCEIFLGDVNFHIVYLLKFQLIGESVTFENVWAQLIVFQNKLLWNLTIFCYGDFSVTAIVSSLVGTKRVLEHFGFVKIVDTIGACAGFGGTNIIFNRILWFF